MPKQNRTLFSNAGALLAIQIAGYILPLLLIPYLTRVLGASLYGVIAFGLAIVQIACVITDYGFGLSATYFIAKNQSNKSELRKIISAVMICKIGLLIPVILLLSGFILLQQKYADYQIYLWLLLLPVVGQTFQPVWFFQGIERMAFITVYTVLSRAMYLGLVIWWVSVSSDYYWVAIANGVSSIVAAAIGIIMMMRLGYWPKWCGWSYVLNTFKDSTEFFWSRAAVATYTAGGAFFLGLVSTPLQVSYYSAAEQLYKGAQSILNPFTQALYPHMAKHQNFKMFFRILKAATIICICGLAIGIFIAPTVITLIFGKDFDLAYPVLLIFMTTFVITTPSMLLGYPFLGALGNLKAANMSVIFAGLLQVLLLLILFLTELTEAIYVALTILAVETFVLIFRARSAVNTFDRLQHENKSL